MVSHFIFLMVVINPDDCLSKRVLLSNFQCNLWKIHTIADGIICLSCCLVLHRSASHKFLLTTEFTSNSLIYYRTVVYRLYLAWIVSRRTYNLLHSNLYHFLHTNSSTSYKFTYIQIGLTILSTLLNNLVHTNLTISYLQIPLKTSHLRIHL